MNILTLLNDSLLTHNQIVWIAVCCVLFVALIATNVLLILYFRKNRERKLCTYQLQAKREELLNQLQILINGGELANETDEDEDEEAILVVNDEDEDDKDDAEQSERNYLGVVAREDVDETMDAEILAVADLSAASRQKLGFAGNQYDDKRYYVRYSYSFEARLRNSSDEVKSRYAELMNDIYQYKVKLQLSYGQIRVYKGRTTLAVITFSGKTLCVAYALNPSDYVNTKYKGIDKSDKKRYAKTPMFIKLTSSRKVQYAKYLMLQLADANTIVMEEHQETLNFDLSAKTVGELLDEDKMRVVILGEVPEGAVQADEEEIAEEVEDEEELKEELAQEEFTRYNRSFIARIIQADDELKARYSELKNHILSYKNVYNKITWKREAFYSDKRACVATFAIRGKTLCLFLAVDPAKFEGTKYKVEDRSAKRPHAKMPTMYRIRSDRSTKFAKEMINIVFAEHGLAENAEYAPINFRPAYKSTENLIKKGYIHASTNQQTDDKK